MSKRDRAAMAVYRTALSAIANAEAVPSGEAVSSGDDPRAGAIESTPLGVGRTEAPRRTLTERDEIAIVRAEISERRAAAESLGTASPAAARQLLADAELLETVLDRRYRS
jgi:uncharacterized protein